MMPFRVSYIRVSYNNTIESLVTHEKSSINWSPNKVYKLDTHYTKL